VNFMLSTGDDQKLFAVNDTSSSLQMDKGKLFFIMNAYTETSLVESVIKLYLI
jgi:hypothetical protein